MERKMTDQYPHIAIMVDTSGLPHSLFLSIRDEVKRSIGLKFPRYRGRVLVEGSPGVISATAYDARGERVSWLERDCEWIVENETFDVLNDHHDHEGMYWDQKIDGWKEGM